MTTYCQCALYRPMPDGSIECQVSWLPTRFAVAGETLRLRERGGEWEDGWIVSTAGAERVAECDLADPRRDVRGHRRGTGDSELKRRSRG
jgi:hypothetical protein